MAFCSNCGAQVAGAFCPNCGTPISAGTAAGSGAAPGNFASPTPVSTGGLEPHIAAALCYIPLFIGLIASIIFLVVSPFNQNKFVRFSAIQSLFLHGALIVFSMLLGVVSALAAMMVHIFSALLLPLWPLFWLAALVLFLFMMYKSFNNQKVKLPFIGDLAERQA